jgi:hypothetical protein
LNDENHKNNNNNNIANDNNDNTIIDKKPYYIENNKLSPIISSKNEQQSENKNNKNQFGKYSYSYRKDNNTNFNIECSNCSNCSNYVCSKNDMKYLEESYSNSIIIGFGKNNSSKRLIRINHNSIENGILSFDNYKYKFEITPFTNNYHPFKVEVGFKVEDIDNKDLNLIQDEDSVNNNIFNCKIASLYDSFELKKNLVIFEKTGTVYVLINIKRGKLFIIGKEELDKRKNKIFLDRNNTNVFFVKNFEPILNTHFLRSIEPVFNFDKKIWNIMKLQLMIKSYRLFLNLFLFSIH